MIMCHPPFFSLFSFSAFLLAVFLFSGGRVLWLRQCELMENVKAACRGALALTRADCGVTPAVLPWAWSWNPISFAGDASHVLSGLLWKPLPTPSTPRLLLTVYHSSYKTWLVSTCDDPGRGCFHGLERRICLITLATTCSNLCRRARWKSRGEGGKKCIFIFSALEKETNFKYTKGNCF